jgi:F0F1-type ATP synthase assembly protein I
MAYRIVVLQLVAVLITASVMSLAGVGQMAAALTAGGVCVLPAAVFAHQASRGRSAARLVGQGVAKMASTVALMAMAFAILEPQALGFFCAFAAAQAMYVVGPLVWREG